MGADLNSESGKEIKEVQVDKVVHFFEPSFQERSHKNLTEIKEEATKYEQSFLPSFEQSGCLIVMGE